VDANIVRLTESLVPAAAAMLARAFHDDPLMRYTIPDPDERARLLPAMYATMLRFGMLAGEVHATANAPEGVAIWMPPNAKWSRENMEASGMHNIPTLIGDHAYQRYREVVGREWQARLREIPGPGWYLFILGVEPRVQRRGLGGALMRPVLDRADAEQLVCYLETENERNVAFYLKHGFDLIVSEEAGSSGVRFWTFSRLPKKTRPTRDVQT
jgi:ribosomal protein S18 acetylase RimI-like enzyme